MAAALPLQYFHAGYTALASAVEAASKMLGLIHRAVLFVVCGFKMRGIWRWHAYDMWKGEASEHVSHFWEKLYVVHT